jgi:hypothetical protein
MGNTTPQQVSREISKTKVKKSTTYRSGLKGQGYRSHEGYSVRNGAEGVIVNYTPATGSSWQGLFEARRHAAMNTIKTTLSEAGYALTASNIYPGALVVEAVAK